MPDWLDNTPAWEQREVVDHYDPDTDQLNSSYLPEPLSFQKAKQRRNDGEPLEYILRHCHIDQITLKTDPRALIPRPETETMVRRFVERVDDLPPGPLVDCGTGTGFMAGWLCEYTDRSVIATECYKEPLSLARENKTQNNWSFSLVQADRLLPLRSFAGVVVNLPYVEPNSEHLSVSVREYEPHGALFPGKDFQVFYRDLLLQIEEKLLPGGEVWIEGDQFLFERLATSGMLNETSLESSFLNDSYDCLRFLSLRT